ncbi:cytochrome d ubiquinol oxidase subunit II [Actinocorallia populi]|uniref:cytochrome d ubiquinol oxidase subunit II n=1 Tax=Actinocorallia populi TaxID=2079200 RepID=UPI000D08B002|nr:cytochrome d ubiquinol oxidase subunit II [Actinocorallia populi]
METLALLLLAFFTFGTLVLAGGDLGAGMLLPRLGRTPAERRTVLAAVGPFFLADEVWLVALAGIMIGAFPGLEHELLLGQRTAFVVLLAGWIVRDAGLWWRGRVEARAWAAACDTMIVAGSWTAALALGAVLGSVLGSVLLAPLFALLLAFHGAGFCRTRLTGEPLERARPGNYAVSTLVLGAVTVAAGLRLDLREMLAEPATLRVVTVFVAVLLPLLVGGQLLTRWAFRQRVTGPGYL